MMRTRAILIAALLVMGSRLSSAQDMTGDWQGTLAVGPQQLRLVLHIQRGEASAWKATFASIDHSPDWGAATPVDSVTVAGTSFTFAVAALRGTYDGTIAADGNAIAGTWTQGRPLPLTFARATSETAWKDPSRHSVQFVAVDSGVKLEVLDWGGPTNANRRNLMSNEADVLREMDAFMGGLK